MNNNSNGSDLSQNSFNGSHMAEISRELSGQAKNRDLGSDSECNRDIDYRYFLKILMERDRSPMSRESSCSRSQWMENIRDHRRDQVRIRDRDGEWNREGDRNFPMYNYNAADLLNSFVDHNRHDLSMTAAYNNDSVPSMNTPWNMNPPDDMTMAQCNVTVNQSSVVSMASHLEMTQTSNFNVNPKRTRWDTPTDNITTSQSNMIVNQNSVMPVLSNFEMAEKSSSSINPYAFVTGPENCSQYGIKASQENNFSLPAKEVIQLTKSVLYPPNPIAPSPSTNEKPKGCKTIFVGGLPFKITKEIIMEIFERYGAVESVRLSLSKTKVPFCHIRFFDEQCVEKAMSLSGYRLKIENKDETPFSSRIHVDYSQAKNDQQDYERKQRAIWFRGQKTNIQKTDIDIKGQNNMTMNRSSGVPMSSNLELTASNVNSCAFMTGIGNSLSVIAPQAINFASPVKEVIQFKTCVLYPPDSKAPRPITRERPPGCKTVFVGGLPYEASSKILQEIFEVCGEINCIKMSKNNLYHIQFCKELSADNALYFSGYKLKIGNIDEAPYSSRLHVHYSVDRDDEHEQQTLERQSRHEETSGLSSTLSVHYTALEASRISEKLKYEETFSQASSVLVSWLEKGECKKNEAGRFYSMIQSTQSHVKKLSDDKIHYEETLNEAKSVFKKQMDANMKKFSEIERVYNAASIQKCWDNFTKTQRKNIEIWKKQTEEIRKAHLEEMINEREDEEMELSDDDNEACKKNVIGQTKNYDKQYIKKLQEDTDFLKSELQAARNELKTAQSEQEESKNQLSTIRTALQNSMKEVLDLNQKYSEAETELKELRALKCRKCEHNEDHHGDDAGIVDAGVSSSINLDTDINLESDIRLVSLISSFLIVQPFGATLDYILPYLCQIDSSINVMDIEKLMKRFPTLFKEETSGTESNLEKKWKFTGFQTSS